MIFLWRPTHGAAHCAGWRILGGGLCFVNGGSRYARAGRRLLQKGARARDRLAGPNERVAQSIASLYNPILSPGTELLLDISQEEIADLAGLSRQRTNEAVKVLVENGLLRVERVGITVLDVDRLRRFAE